MGNPGWERRTRSFVYSFIHWVGSLTCLSWSDFIGTLHWLQKIFGRSMRLTQLTSRYEKVCDFHFHFVNPIFLYDLVSWEVWVICSTCWLMDFGSACDFDILCWCYMCFSLLIVKFRGHCSLCGFRGTLWIDQLVSCHVLFLFLCRKGRTTDDDSVPCCV